MERSLALSEKDRKELQQRADSAESSLSVHNQAMEKLQKTVDALKHEKVGGI